LVLVVPVVLVAVLPFFFVLAVGVVCAVASDPVTRKALIQKLAANFKYLFIGVLSKNLFRLQQATGADSQLPQGSWSYFFPAYPSRRASQPARHLALLNGLHTSRWQDASLPLPGSRAAQWEHPQQRPRHVQTDPDVPR
jgi:hypothetical protein